MKLLELLRRESAVSLRGLLLTAVLAGIGSALILPIINTAAKLAAHRETSFRLLVLFAIVTTVYAVSQRHFMVRAIAEVEKVLDRMRVRIADKIRRCDLEPLEQIGRTVIYSSVTTQTVAISQAALMMVVSAQYLIVVVFAAIYVFVLSPLAFALTAACTTAIIISYRARLVKIHKQLAESAARENDLFVSLMHMVEGFKEVRLNRARSDDLYRRFEELSHSVRDRKATSMGQISTTFVLSQVWFYLLLGVIVFLVPRLTETYTDQVVQITTAVLFLTGPIAGLVGSAQHVAAAEVAADTIAAIEAQLDRSLGAQSDDVERRTSFREIEFDKVVFHYAGEEGETFTVGPIDLTIRAGEVLFIAGGNGSGKSTFLKLLTALYFPSQGSIRIDGQPVTGENVGSYRSLFATVFSDFHLFRRLYGLYDVAQEEIDSNLDLIELSGKTHIADSAFDTLELSGGQRKRLSLLVSLLEDRPIYVFDEMAADQDPAFRRKFYKDILPWLHGRGKTVVAVTHDDKYFEDAGRLLKMDEGRLVSYELTH
jgi:putative pyoverdin transport system ATP-binding/permease protein